MARNHKNTQTSQTSQAASGSGSSQIHRPSQPPTPTHRQLRGYAFDPSLATQLETALVSEITFKVPWEKLEPGPVGEYVEVVDYDPASALLLRPGRPGRPAHPRAERPRAVRRQSAVPPADGLRRGDDDDRPLRARARPQGDVGRIASTRDRGAFRRRRDTCSGCASTRTRCAWRTPTTAATSARCCSATSPATEERTSGAVPRRHGLHLPLARHRRARDDARAARRVPSSTSWSRPTRTCSPSTRRSPTSWRSSSTSRSRRCSRTRSRGRAAIWASENLLAQLATQFGHARGTHGALRDAIGKYDTTAKKWVKHVPDPTELDNTHEVARARRHPRRGRVRCLPVDLSPRGRAICCGWPAAAPACCARASCIRTWSTGWRRRPSKAAGHVLNMCIRALDYCPPVDLTFGEYLRALITRRHGSDAGGRARLPGRVHRGLPAPRHLSRATCARCRKTACAGRVPKRTSRSGRARWR